MQVDKVLEQGAGLLGWIIAASMAVYVINQLLKVIL